MCHKTISIQSPRIGDKDFGCSPDSCNRCGGCSCDEDGNLASSKTIFLWITWDRVDLHTNILSCYRTSLVLAPVPRASHFSPAASSTSSPSSVSLDSLPKVPIAKPLGATMVATSAASASVTLRTTLSQEGPVPTGLVEEGETGFVSHAPGFLSNSY